MTKTIQHTHSPILLFIVLFSIQLVFSQKKYTVNNTPGTAADFSDIQKAIDFAKNGDTIYVQHSANSYNGFTLNKRLYIYGRSHSLPDYITTINGDLQLTKNGSGSVIQAMYFQKGITTSNNAGDISNIILQNNKLSGITLSTTSNYSFNNILIIGNVFEGDGEVFIGENCQNISFTNNVSSLDFRFDMNSNTLTIKNNIFNKKNKFLFNSKNGTLNISDCIFVCYNKFEGNVNFTNENSSKTIVKNCYAFNYKGIHSIFGDEQTELIDCTENKDPLFLKVGEGETSISKNKFNPLEDDLRLQPNSPVKGGAGVFGN